MANDTQRAAIGINQNVLIGSIEYHIQTEDLRQQAMIRSQVFIEGAVKNQYELDYSQAVKKENLTAIVGKAIKCFHAKIIKSLQSNDNELVPPHSTVKINTATTPVVKLVPVKKSVSEVWNALTMPQRRLERPSWDQIVANNREKR
jgi:hypothetical protein